MLPSLESVSSDASTDSEPGLERIEKLEAILNNIALPSDSSVPIIESRAKLKNSHTQTLSTGDIVMTKIFSEQ